MRARSGWRKSDARRGRRAAGKEDAGGRRRSAASRFASSAIDSEIVRGHRRSRRGRAARPGSTTAFHGSRPARRWARARPATEPGTPEASGPSSRGGRRAAGTRRREEVAAGGAGRHLAEVERRGRCRLRVARDPEAAAADVAGFGPRDGQGEGDGDGGVGRVAAPFEDRDADPRGVLLGRGHRSAGAPRRGLGRPAAAAATADAREGAQALRRDAVSLRYSTGPMKSIRDLPLRGRKLFLRVDFNVPLDGRPRLRRHAHRRDAADRAPRAGAAARASSAPPTSARPRASGSPSSRSRRSRCGSPSCSARPVRFVDDCVGPEAAPRGRRARRRARSCCSRTSASTPARRRNDPEFAQALAALADVYVDDAFGAAHRAHASVVGVPQLLTEKGAGLLLEKEVRELSRLLEPAAAVRGDPRRREDLGQDRHPARPLAPGGRAARRRRHGEPLRPGARPVRSASRSSRRTRSPLAREILDYCKEAGKTIALPSDFVVAKSPDDARGRADGRRSTRSPTDAMALDVGPKTLEQFARLLGAGEDDLLERADGRLREAALRPGHDGARDARRGLEAVTVVGGGESVQAAHAAGVADKFTHVSTGGGASLEFLAEGRLPGHRSARAE